MNSPTGSEWRKWDLHVHTPESHTAQYGSGEGAWSRYLEELSALPPEIKVIGINDYLWVDGYERVLGHWRAGHLSNLEAIFPVIELRLRDFFGSDGKLSRLNAHAIFSPQTDPQIIRDQFVGALASKFVLSDEYSGEDGWSAIPTRSSLEDLGRRIKASVPPDELSKYGSDFVEGFNSWVIPLDAVLEAVDNSAFPEKPLIALGKTEWASIPWTDNTIASKKSLISKAQLLFTAASSASAWHNSVQELKKASVNYRVLDCSDAHHFSDSPEKDRIGNCGTWICADSTLAGLRHALIEFDSRVFVGDKPPLLVRRDSNPTQFIQQIDIAPVDAESAPKPGFNISIPLNSGFVAVIGNKGSGKSALLDSLALVADSSSEAEFSFLSDQRYRSSRTNHAQHYQATLTTVEGEIIGPKSLADNVGRESPERVRYLPQSQLESLCNKEPDAPDDAFESELRSIIFSHVPEHDRLDSDSLDELVDRRTEAIEHEIVVRRSELTELNHEIADLEELLRPSRLKGLRTQQQALHDQLQRHDSTRPPSPVVPEPSTDPAVVEATNSVEQARARQAELRDERSRLESVASGARAKIDATNNLLIELDTLRSQVEDLIDRTRDLASVAGVDLHELVTVAIDRQPLIDIKAASTQESTITAQRLGDSGEIAAEEQKLREKVEDLTAALDRPRLEYEQQLRDLQEWQKARDRIVGSRTAAGTQAYVDTQLEEIERIPSQLEDLRTRRAELLRSIHNSLLSKLAVYSELYGPVQSFLDHNELAAEEFSLEFEVGLEVRDFGPRLLSYIDRGVTGTFYGVDASQRLLRERVAALDPEDIDSILAFTAETDLDLRYDRRTSKSRPLDCATDVLRTGTSLAEVYDYLFGLSYLDPQYELRSEGKPISRLSPGQKGTILLMFYLLVDKTGLPIAMDQPDENLDSETIHRVLRPAIRNAKQTRQVFVVTHSPNLAVVGDADQVIVATGSDAGFAYTSGAIENPAIRDLVVDILEGTWPAYDDRGRKYSAAARL